MTQVLRPDTHFWEMIVVPLEAHYPLRQTRWLMGWPKSVAVGVRTAKLAAGMPPSVRLVGIVAAAFASVSVSSSIYWLRSQARRAAAAAVRSADSRFAIES